MNYAPEKSTPVFNVPNLVLAFIGILFVVHIIRTLLVSADGNLWAIINFAFIPARYELEGSSFFTDPASWWTPVTYSFLHGDWTHIIVNSVWLLAFGSVVAKRFGNVRFAIFCIFGSCLGALAHYLFHAGSIIPMVGASAVVSACMGAAVRFAFPRSGRFSPTVHNLPAQSLLACFTNVQVIVFTTVWFVINLIFGLGGELVVGAGQSIAWEAHVGGFLCGLLLFRYFDPK